MQVVTPVTHPEDESKVADDAVTVVPVDAALPLQYPVLLAK
jgi:hypothetical protein